MKLHTYTITGQQKANVEDSECETDGGNLEENKVEKEVRNGEESEAGLLKLNCVNASASK
jgi:hypothetical protein